MGRREPCRTGNVIRLRQGRRAEQKKFRAAVFQPSYDSNSSMRVLIAARSAKAVQLLWMGTLGSVCFTASEGTDDALYPSLQEMMTEMILQSLFKEAAARKKQ